MTERRSHWDTDLIEGVGRRLIPLYRSIGYCTDAERHRIYTLIEFVEDWHKEKRDSRVRTHSEGCWRWHNECAEALIEYQQATITRVRDVVENTIILANDAGISYPNVSAEAVLRALEGGSDD